jgi:serine/threonine protein kinase
MVKKTYKKYNKKKTEKKRASGGRAFDSGGFGCVFNPAIKCADRTIPYSSNNISKLMLKEEAEFEITEIAKIKKFIAKMPNKEDYFLISNTRLCHPEKLQNEDLDGFDEECTIFSNGAINSKNINENLNKMALIVMPNGGSNVKKYILKILELPEKEMYRKFAAVNTALIKLLVNGIAPLNSNRFNHYDIKAENILISGEDGHARLIDWGLASENDGVHIPEIIKNRPISFNMPFSDIFYNNFVKTLLPAAFNKIKSSNNLHDKTTGQSELLKIVAVNMINESIEKTSEGHYDYITSIILHKIYKIYANKNTYNRLDYNVLSSNVLIEYVHAVLLKYVDDNGNFKDIAYFYDVFSKNVDLWGFLLAYVPIIEYGIDKFHIDIINGVCRILLKYCFSTEFATKPININELKMDLQSLNDIVNAVINNSNKHNKITANRSVKRSVKRSV